MMRIKFPTDELYDQNFINTFEIWVAAVGA
jgi:hypothetical protein